MKATEIKRLVDEILDENRRLREVIREFCNGQAWADKAWKEQPHIKALFDINSEG
jgi:hypothetical protein